MRKKRKGTEIIRLPKLFVILPTLASLLSAYLLLSEGGIFTYITQMREISNIKDKIKQLEAENKEIEQKIELIKGEDEKYLDYIFRKFGWVKKDEKVLKIE